MRDALRSYLQIATGLTEMTVHRVTEAARHLVEKSGVDLDQVPTQVAQQAQAVPQYVQQVADELFATGKANRGVLVGVVRSEVDKAMGRLRPWLDDVKRVEDDLARVEQRVTDLEHRLAVASAPPRASRAQTLPIGDEESVPVRGAGTRSRTAGAREADEDLPVAKRAVTPARAARKAAAKKAPAKKATAGTAAKKAAKTTAKTAAKKTTPGAGDAKRTTGAPAKKSAPGGAAAQPAKPAPERKSPDSSTQLSISAPQSSAPAAKPAAAAPAAVPAAAASSPTSSPAPASTPASTQPAVPAPKPSAPATPPSVTAAAPEPSAPPQTPSAILPTSSSAAPSPSAGPRD